jgi:hypothetical protein
MRPTLLTRRAISYSVLALATATMLVACDNQPVAPTPVASAPTAPSLAIGSRNNTLTILVVDETGALVTTGVAQFLVQNKTTGNGFFTLDNNYNDADPMFGRLLVTGLVSGSYQVCQNNQAPIGYTLPSTPCQTVIVGGIVAGKVTFVNPKVGAEL